MSIGALLKRRLDRAKVGRRKVDCVNKHLLKWYRWHCTQGDTRSILNTASTAAIISSVLYFSSLHFLVPTLSHRNNLHSPLLTRNDLHLSFLSCIHLAIRPSAHCYPRYRTIMGKFASQSPAIAVSTSFLRSGFSNKLEPWRCPILSPGLHTTWTSLC